MTKTTKPRKVHIDVTESGTKTADVRLPYGMFRLGMKYGKDAAAKETDACARAMACLKDFDCAAFERSVASSAILLPHVLFQMDDAESNTQVILTAE
jgi:hypothetical protein